MSEGVTNEGRVEDVEAVEEPEVKIGAFIGPDTDGSDAAEPKLFVTLACLDEEIDDPEEAVKKGDERRIEGPSSEQPVHLQGRGHEQPNKGTGSEPVGPRARAGWELTELNMEDDVEDASTDCAAGSGGASGVVCVPEH